MADRRRERHLAGLRNRFGIGSMAMPALLAAGCAGLPDEESVVAGGPSFRAAIVPGEYVITPDNADVEFMAGPTPAGVIEGAFTSFRGVMTVRDAVTGDASLSAVLHTASLELDGEFFQDTLRGPGWFEVETWPKARFDGELSAWRIDDTAVISGPLVIRDVTANEGFTLRLTCEGLADCPGEVVGYRGVLEIDRTRYGMTRMQGLAGNMVRITVTGTLEAEARR